MKKRKYILLQLSRITANILLIFTLVAVFFGFYVCPIYGITGIKCPGCGITRACKAAIRFDFESAFEYNCLFPIPFLWGAYEVLRLWIRLPKKGEIIFYSVSIAFLVLRWCVLMINTYLI